MKITKVKITKSDTFIMFMSSCDINDQCSFSKFEIIAGKFYAYIYQYDHNLNNLLLDIVYHAYMYQHGSSSK